METVNKTIVIFLGHSQYNSMRNMSEEIGLAFVKLGFQVIIIDLLEKDWVTKLETTIKAGNVSFFFGMNGWGADIKSGENSIYDVINIPLFAFFVDHPLYHIDRLKLTIKNLVVSFVDKSHLEDINYFVGSVATKVFIPHGTDHTNEIRKPISERKIDILFTGSGVNPDQVLNGWTHLPSGMRKVMMDTSEKLLNGTNKNLQTAFFETLEQMDIKIDTIYSNSVGKILYEIDRYTRFYRRRKLIEGLLDCPISIYGSGWDFLLHQKNIQAKVYSSVDATTMKELLKETKIALNIFPNFPNGTHERIFDCMMMGAACLTDENSYVSKRYTHNNDIIYYQHNDPLLSEKIKGYLENEELLQNIANNGLEQTNQNHTWINRASKIVESIDIHHGIRAIQ
ncbi:glycosyltransferase [Niallia sp. JL1B1071]|uniref:glycosyltransferase family protein n=1 Tax=Niallia tiangongensis TaxID=3237105 RepID=UPI0037DC5332